MPDMYHARTGHVLPLENSHVHAELIRTEQHAVKNEMLINYKKTKVMLFNPCTSIDFMPSLELGGHELEVVEEMRLLGLTIRSDLKWNSNTDNMVLKAYKRVWIIRRLKNLGAEDRDLVDIYYKQIRSVLELAVPVWHGGITQAEHHDIERVQRSVCHIILGSEYVSYKNAMQKLSLQSLYERRDKLCLKFAKKCEKHAKHTKWFKLSGNNINTRGEKTKYCDVRAQHSRFKNSPLGFLTNLLNEHYSKK